MIDDSELLKTYARDRSDGAFGELVQRHLTLVYSAALRRTDGDTHRAKDVAQIVFTALARDAAALSSHPVLTGWLYTATRNAAIDLMRTERRRRRREEEALTMEQISSPAEPPADWEQLRPVLDDVMEELDEHDREAVLLRFFEGQPFAAVAAVLRVSEDAARKRVDRALDRLGVLLAGRGITSTGGALAVLLANQAAIAAPAGAAGAITNAALAGAATGSAGAGIAGLFIMSTSKVVAGITAVVALVAIGSAIYQARLSRDTVAAISAERDDLRARLGAVDQRAQAADEKLAATVKELSGLRASGPKASGVPAPRAAPSQGGAMDYVLDHPETHAVFLEQQKLRAKTHYDRFFKASGLSAEQQERLLSEVTDVRAGELDLMGALRDQGYGVGNLPKDTQALQRMMMERKQSFDANLRATLGDDGYTAFQQYSRTIPERNVADQLASQLYYTAEPLTAQQADQLSQILAQNRFVPQATPSPSTTLNGTFVDAQAFGRRMGQVLQQSGMNMLEWAAPVTDAAMGQAETVLTPTQLAALRRVQAQQAAQFKLAPPPAGSAGSK